MKKILIGLGCLALLAVVALAEFTTGWGKTFTATPTAQGYTNLNVNALTVYNTGTNLVYALVNTTHATFTGRVGLATTVVIPGSNTFTFDCQTKALISSFFYSCAPGSTCTVYASGF